MTCVLDPPLKQLENCLILNRHAASCDHPKTVVSRRLFPRALLQNDTNCANKTLDRSVRILPALSHPTHDPSEASESWILRDDTQREQCSNYLEVDAPCLLLRIKPGPRRARAPVKAGCSHGLHHGDHNLLVGLLLRLGHDGLLLLGGEIETLERFGGGVHGR